MAALFKVKKPAALGPLSAAGFSIPAGFFCCHVAFLYLSFSAAAFALSLLPLVSLIIFKAISFVIACFRAK